MRRASGWAWRCFRAIFTWEVCGAFCAYAVVALLVALFADNTTARYAAQNSLTTARTLTSARVTALNDQIDCLSAELNHDSLQRGELIAELRAANHQLRQLGVTPIVPAPQTLIPAGVPGNPPCPTGATK